MELDDLNPMRQKKKHKFTFGFAEWVAQKRARKFYHKEVPFSVMNGDEPNEEATTRLNEVFYDMNNGLELLFQAEINAGINGADSFGLEWSEENPVLFLNGSLPEFTFLLNKPLKSKFNARYIGGTDQLQIIVTATRTKYKREVNILNEITTLAEAKEKHGISIAEETTHDLGFVPSVLWENQQGDPTLGNWERLADIALVKHLLPAIDDAYDAMMWEIRMAQTKIIISAEEMDMEDANNWMQQKADELTRQAIFVFGGITGDEFEYIQGDFKAAIQAIEILKFQISNVLNRMGYHDDGTPNKKAQTNNLEVFAMSSGETFTINSILQLRQKNMKKLLNMIMTIDIEKTGQAMVYGENPSIFVEIIEPKERDNGDYVNMLSTALNDGLLDQITGIQKLWGVSYESAKKMAEKIKVEFEAKMKVEMEKMEAEAKLNGDQNGEDPKAKDPKAKDPKAKDPKAKNKNTGHK